MNPRAWQLLHLLSDGEFHSGEALAGELGVSRATVFNDMSLAEQAGVHLQRIRGRGYRLPSGWQPLDGNEVARCLGTVADRFRIEIMQQAESSNTELLRRINMPSGSVLAVELQTAGRGRLGRTWHSGLGNALTFSLSWRFECGLNGLSGLSLAVGIAVFRTLQRFGAEGMGLKWPNDIQTARGKLGGVLIEVQGDMYGPSHAVIGIGINLSLPAKIAQSIGQPAISLDQVCSLPPERNHLMAALLKELAAVLDVFSVRGFSVLREEWEACHAQQNLPIRLQMPDGKTVAGIARGVGDNGELMLETEQGMQRYNAGEVGA